jgi:hypothetical protein
LPDTDIPKPIVLNVGITGHRSGVLTAPLVRTLRPAVYTIFRQLREATLKLQEAEPTFCSSTEAQLAALKKAQAKAASSQLASASPELAAKKNGKTSTAEITATPDAAVSSATLSQFNSTIDDARSMAKQVMHSGSGQNVQLARNYDSYLKTLQASMRGIQTEKEAQKLLKQANQTRAYIVFLQKQPASQ